MAEINIFDSATTYLLCNEETNALCFHDADQINGGECNGVSESQPLMPLTEESILWMVDRELHHLPRHDYVMRLKNGDLDLSLRFEALDWIIKACSYHNFGELCLYSAMNFVDRFLSFHNLPEGRSWAIHLLAVSCLSLSAKINEVNVPCILELQVGESKFKFEGKTIQRMEILVLNCLNWNMNVYTPFSFIDYFVRKVTGREQGDLIERSIEIILSTIKGIGFLEFRASEVAAAVAVCVSEGIQAVDIDKALFGCIGRLEKGRVMQCLEMVRNLVSRNENTMATPSTITATVTTAGVDNGGVVLPMSFNPNGVQDVTTTSVDNREVILPIPLSQDGTSDVSAFTSTITTTIVTTASVDIGEVILPMPLSPDGTSDASASISTVAATAISTSSADNGTYASRVPRSPNGVLDAVFMSVESCPSSSHTSPDTKRRKLDNMTAVSGGS